MQKVAHAVAMNLGGDIGRATSHVQQLMFSMFDGSLTNT